MAIKRLMHKEVSLEPTLVVACVTMKGKKMGLVPIDVPTMVVEPQIIKELCLIVMLPLDPKIHDLTSISETLIKWVETLNFLKRSAKIEWHMLAKI